MSDITRPQDSITIAVCALKGGAARTTTAVHLAALLSPRYRTLLIDSDPGGSAVEWVRVAQIPQLDAVGATGERMRQQIRAAAEGYQVVVIDTPSHDAGAVREAMLAADGVILPLRPSKLDERRVPATLAVAGEAVAAGGDFWFGALLCLVVSGTRSRTETRSRLTRSGLDVLTTEIRNWESVANSFYREVPVTSPYAQLVAEIDPRLPSVPQVVARHQ